jgi:hypothetical protein
MKVRAEGEVRVELQSVLQPATLWCEWSLYRRTECPVGRLALPRAGVDVVGENKSFFSVLRLAHVALYSHWLSCYTHIGCLVIRTLAVWLYAHWLSGYTHIGCLVIRTLAVWLYAHWLSRYTHIGCLVIRTLAVSLYARWLSRYTHIGCLVIYVKDINIQAICYSVWNIIISVKRNWAKLNAGERSNFCSCDVI